MQRFCLASLRFCLSAWLGIAIFFVMVAVGLHHSPHFDQPVKFNFPRVLFPLYYAWEFSLLGAGLLCACVGMGNAKLGKLRRGTILAALAAAVGLALFDYTTVYHQLVVMMETPTEIPAARFVELHEMSRSLNKLVMVLTAIAATLAHWGGKGGRVLDQSCPHDAIHPSL